MVRAAGLVAGVFLLMWPCALQAGEKDFSVQGVTMRLEDAPDVQARYQAMRFNRALGVWNVDVALTNCGSRIMRAPFLVTLDYAADTVRAIAPDGYDGGDTNKPFYDLSAYVTGSTLVPGGVTPKRTLSLSGTGAAPQLGGRVYSRPPAEPFALSVAQVLDASGQLLPDVEVVESGPQGFRMLTNDAETACAMLGQTAGAYVWRFGKAGYLPVWRRSVLADGVVGAPVSPRLTPRASHGTTMTGAAGGTLSVPDSGLRVAFPAGVFAEDTPAVLTPLGAQSLPAPLPYGWSPLQAFWLELDGEPDVAGTATLTFWDHLQSGEPAAFVRWDPASAEWKTVSLVTGDGGDGVTLALPGGGAYAVVVGDSDPATAPPVPVPGEALTASAATLPSGAGLTAAGHVEPPVVMASGEAGAVTALASVVVTNAAGPVPSGLVFPVDVNESYRMQDGVRRRTPQYTTALAGYQRPGDGDARTLHAQVALRPQLLLGSAELAEAAVTFDVQAPDAFATGLFDADGGRIENNGVVLLAGFGDLTGPQSAGLRVLSPMDFAAAATGATVLAAFEVRVGGLASGRHLAARVSATQTNGFFVLARVVSERGLSGLEPVERLAPQASGVLAGAEPDAEPKLPGITRTGQYVVLALAAPQALVSGVVSNRLGVLSAGVSLQVVGQPWVTFSGSGGAYRLLAPAGACVVMATDAANGDTGFADAVVGQDLAAVVADLATGESGPRVLSVSPANGAVAVPRVSSVAVTFSEAVNPATLGQTGIRVVDTNGQAVAAAVKLNLRGTVATLLPNARLEPAMRYTVSVTNAVADLGGQTLVGAREFVFTTARDALDRVGAQVVSYEPTNGLVRMVGSPGTADPESPVILVNETSGRTATVLSAPDGSFDNWIEADVDDYLSAVVVNENGTRNTIPVSRQLFRDGSVGLFNGGGILEAESDGGPVQVIIEPGAIAGKTKFKMESIPALELLAIISNAPPVGAEVLGGLHIQLGGDPVTKSPHISLPVDPASLDLQEGESPTNAMFVLARPRDVDGVPVYEAVDEMFYENGRVVTHSWVDFWDPDVTLVSICQRGIAGGVVVSGRVVCETATQPRMIAGATVMAVDKDTELNVHGRVNRGSVIAVSGRNGEFTLKVPVYLGVNTVQLIATSLYFPGQYGLGNVWISRDAIGVGAVVKFTPRTAAALTDTVQPTLSLLPSPTLPSVSQVVDLLVRGTDNATAPALTLDVVQPDPSDLSPPDVTVTRVGTETLAQTTRDRYSVSVTRSGRVVLRATATDGAGFQSTAQTALLFTDEPRYPIPNQGADTTGPYAVWTVPRNNGTDEDAFQPITILFNEAVSTNVLLSLSNAIQIVPSAGTLTGQLSADGRELTVYASLSPNTTYSVTLNGEIHDRSGNEFFQYPGDATQTYNFTFKTRAIDLQRLPNVVCGVGVVSDPEGHVFYSVERGGTWASDKLRVISTNLTGVSLQEYGKCDLPLFPREVAYIGPYDWQDISGRMHDSVLVAVAGGLVGEHAPWLCVVDVKNPRLPVVLARAELTYSSAASVSGLHWSAPMLAYLQISGGAEDVTSVGLVNLQLFLYVHTATTWGNNNFSPFTHEVQSAGRDLNGDGDYVDAGEDLPHINGMRLVAGVENGGLVAAFNVPFYPNGSPGTEVIQDFSVLQGGRFVAVVHGPGQNGASAGYRTLAADGVPLARYEGFYPFPETPVRVSVFQGVPIMSTNGLQQINLAVVSGGQGRKVLSFLDVTDPRTPVSLKDLTFPDDWGRPWSAQMGLDGRLMIGTSASTIQAGPGLVVIEPRLLLLPSQAPVHPALVGIVRGPGVSSRAFVGLGGDRFAVAQGGVTYASMPLALPSVFDPQSISVTDAAGDLPRVAHSGGRIELVPHTAQNNSPGLNTSHLLACEATPPPNVPVPPGQPGWSVPDIPAQATGLTTQLSIPDYDNGLFNTLQPFLFLCPPDQHTLHCGSHTVDVRVYPANKNQVKIDAVKLAQAAHLLRDIPNEIQSTLSALPGGYFEQELCTPVGILSFENQWKEQSNTVYAGWTFVVEAKMDPLIGYKFRGGWRASLPAFLPLVGGRGFDAFIEVAGNLMVKALLERDEFSNYKVKYFGVTPNPFGDKGFGLEVVCTPGVEVNLEPIGEASLIGESKLEGWGYVGFNDTNTKLGLKQCSAQWSGVVVKGVLKLGDGLVEMNTEFRMVDEKEFCRNQDFFVP